MSIQRIDRMHGKNYGTHGYQARLDSKTPPGTTRFFADRKHGGKRQARRLALNWLTRRLNARAKMK